MCGNYRRFCLFSLLSHVQKSFFITVHNARVMVNFMDVNVVMVGGNMVNRWNLEWQKKCDVKCSTGGGELFLEMERFMMVICNV